MIYKPKQIDQMREELSKIYEANHAKNPKYSYPTLAAAIDDHFEDLREDERATLPPEYRHVKTISLRKTDNFRKFVIGESGSMEDLSMLAIDFWLTDPNNGESTLTKEKLHGLSVYPKIAALLAEFLHENSDETPKISIDKLKGDYKGINSSGTSELELSIYGHNSEHAFSVRVTERLFSTRHVNMNDNTQNTHFGMAIHKGWIVVSPDDSLFFLLKNEAEESNHIYVPLGINGGVHDGDDVSLMFFLDRKVNTCFDEVILNKNNAELLSRWIQENRDNVIRFNRI